MKRGSKVLWIAQRLQERYGPIVFLRGDPVETLVRTILSQNTSDTNRDRAFRALLDRFGDLKSVREAPVEKIAQAIRVGGLHRQKAVRIQQVLRRIEKKMGSLDLSFLVDLSLEEGMAWLLASPGVGRKTAGIVMLFCLSKPYFPVDTHIQRVLTRMGILSGKEDPHERMNTVLPADLELMKTLHLGLIRFGREVCHPRNPRCSICPLCSKCEWGKEHTARKEGICSSK